MTPEDRRYAKTHEWVKIENGLAVIGITDHAQAALGDITFVELPEVGHVVKRSEECGVIESVKAASDLYAPVSGEVCEVNTALETRPEVVNEDPYGKGWILKLKNFDRAGVERLMDAAEYEGSFEEDEKE